MLSFEFRSIFVLYLTPVDVFISNKIQYISGFQLYTNLGYKLNKYPLFGRWIRRKIVNNCVLKEGEDYRLRKKWDIRDSRPGRPRKDFWITTFVAKSICISTSTALAKKTKILIEDLEAGHTKAS